jgi:hypothetical protein
LYGIGGCIETCWEVELVKKVFSKQLMSCLIEREQAFVIISRVPHMWCLLVLFGTLGACFALDGISYKRNNEQYVIKTQIY